MKALPTRKADKVAEACIDLLNSEAPQSITFDNGKEFAQHQRMSHSAQDRGILCQALSFMGARHEREYERFDTSILAQIHAFGQP